MNSAIDGTLKGNSIRETLQILFTDENFHQYVTFDRIGFATISNNRITAKIGVVKLD
jgi:hypothetical protein